MATMIIRHKVSDYAVWRKVYDAFEQTQKRLGVRAEAVYQSVDDPLDITVTHDFDSVAAAKAFAESPELRETIGSAGVVGQPDIWYTTRT